MKLEKKYLIVIGLVVIFLAVSLFYYFWGNGLAPDSKKLEMLRGENPNLSSYVDGLKKASENFKEDNVQSYATLGLAWKSLADQTRSEDHYEEALTVYEKAVELTERKNTMFILNAGNMASYIKDYELARNYYEEAISAAPGDIDGYQKLIELNIYQLKSDKDLIVDIFDRGIKRMLNPASLVQWKESYLKSLEDK
ncbi:MAG: tetratricopeptide repeat protein [Patescibacteria group bacterium]